MISEAMSKPVVGTNMAAIQWLTLVQLVTRPSPFMVLGVVVAAARNVTDTILLMASTDLTNLMAGSLVHTLTPIMQSRDSITV